MLTTSVKGCEADFHSLPGKRTSFWKTSSMNSVCPASASVNKLQHKVHVALYSCKEDTKCDAMLYKTIVQRVGN